MRFGTAFDNITLKAVEEGEFQPIKMEQMTQVLAIPLLGVILGTGIIIIEICNKHCGLQNLKKILQKKISKIWENMSYMKDTFRISAWKFWRWIKSK